MAHRETAQWAEIMTAIESQIRQGRTDFRSFESMVKHRACVHKISALEWQTAIDTSIAVITRY